MKNSCLFQFICRSLHFAFVMDMGSDLKLFEYLSSWKVTKIMTSVLNRTNLLFLFSTALHTQINYSNSDFVKITLINRIVLLTFSSSNTRIKGGLASLSLDPYNAGYHQYREECDGENLKKKFYVRSACRPRHTIV